MRFLTTTLGLLFTSVFALSLAGCGSSDPTGGGGGSDIAPTEITLAKEFLAGKPRFSPDGKTIAYIQSSSTSLDKADLAVMDSTGGARKTLSPANSYLAAPAWTPDAKQLYFSADAGINVVAAAGGAATMISNDFTATDPDVSPDGKSLVYAPNGGSMTILDLTDPTLKKDLGSSGTSPRFSPDGKSIAFADDDKIKTMDLASGTVTQVADGGSYLSSVAWFQSGKELAFTSDKGVETVTLGASPVRTMLHEEFAAESLDLSHDGKTIIYSVNGSGSLFVLTGF
jgi:Tol biopolymer transport system component